MNRTRKLVYSALALPLLISGLGLISMSPLERSGFLVDYRRNLNRILMGEWSITELTESDRRGPTDGRGRRWSESYGMGAVFAALDRNSDKRLEFSEVGERMRRQLGWDAADLGQLSSSQFNDRFRNKWGTEIGSIKADSSIQTPRNASRSGEVGELTAEHLFDETHVAEVKITMNDSDWQALCRQSRDRSAFENPLDKPYTNFPADIEVDGVRIENVGIRKKGFIGSQDTIRPSLKIKFDEYVDQDPIAGLDRLTLNNNKQDHSLLSQALTYRLFRKAGVHAPRSSYATVTVNGKYLGVYSHVESVRKPFLRRCFGNDAGTLYEGTLADVYPLAIHGMEAKNKRSEKDLSKLIELAELLDSPGSLSLDGISQLVDVDYFLRYWAIESLINFWDGYSQNQNNYFMYSNPANGMFYFMPWGADSCFGSSPRWGRGNSRVVNANSILANRLYHIEDIPDRYRTTLEVILKDIWDEKTLLETCDRLQSLLLDHIGFEQAHCLVAMNDVREFIRGRRELITQELDRSWPITISPSPRIPRHTITIGAASGQFATQWQNAESETTGGTVDATITYDEETLPFTSVTASLRASDPSIGTITFETLLDGRPHAMALIMDVGTYELGTAEEKIGVAMSGRWGRARRQQIDAQIKLTEFGPNAGDTISGTFTLTIRETRGGRW